MIKYIPSIFLLCFLFYSCENAIKDEASADKETPENLNVEDPVHSQVNNNTTVNDLDDLTGYWVGWFLPDDNDEYKNVKAVGDVSDFNWARENKITVSIDTIRNDSVIGHSIVAGNFRPFIGTIKTTDDSFVINTQEPGDDKYDGTFSFSINQSSDSIHGKWNAFKKVQTPKRTYSLIKKAFEYKPDAKIRNNFVDWLKTKTIKDEYEGEWYEMESYFATTEKVTTLNPSTEKLRENQVSELKKADIYVLRNSIYAKHGYSFKKRQLRVFFDSHDWYMPVHVNIKSDLTEIEKQNIKLLLRYEKYAEEYYDEFGRG